MRSSPHRVDIRLRDRPTFLLLDDDLLGQRLDKEIIRRENKEDKKENTY